MESIQDRLRNKVPCHDLVALRNEAADVIDRLQKAVNHIRETMPHGLVLCEDADGNFFVDDAPRFGMT